MSLTVNLIRLRYRLWRLDQAETMTAERATRIVAVLSIAGFAAITALLHLPTGQYIAGIGIYAVALLSGIRAGIALDDLIERLERASEELLGLRSQYDLASYEGNRLLGKCQGVELAPSYAREAKRDDDNDAEAEAAFQEYLDEGDQ